MNVQNVRTTNEIGIQNQRESINKASKSWNKVFNSPHFPNPLFFSAELYLVFYWIQFNCSISLFGKRIKGNKIHNCNTGSVTKTKQFLLSDTIPCKVFVEQCIEPVQMVPRRWKSLFYFIIFFFFVRYLQKHKKYKAKSNQMEKAIRLKSKL